MRTLTLPLPLLILITASAASAQNTQTAVDIGVSTPKYSNGMVEARVTRKDPTADKSAPAPTITVRVTSVVPSSYCPPESIKNNSPGEILRLVLRVTR